MLAAPGCATTQDRSGSIWPPKDWYLEVGLGRLDAKGFVPQLMFQAWSDGYALWREAEPANGDTPAPWPALWSRVSAYRMTHESTRQLARLVAGAGLETMPKEIGSLADADTPVFSFGLHGFGATYRVTSHGAEDPKVARLLHIVNAFLPKGESLASADMTGDPEDPHLSRVPLPKSSRAGALELYEGLLDRQPGRDGFAIDAFALAVALGDRPRAERLLKRIETAELAESRPFALAGEPSALVPTLRALLPK